MQLKSKGLTTSCSKKKRLTLGKLVKKNGKKRAAWEQEKTQLHKLTGEAPAKAMLDSGT